MNRPLTARPRQGLRFVFSAAGMAVAVVAILAASPVAQAARIGLLLGTFDPPHLGIARMVGEARTRLGLDTVYVLPTPMPVDRPAVTLLRHRLAMLHLMAQDVGGLETLTEADLLAIASRRPHNLFAALREDLVRRHSPADEFFQIVGEDALPKLIARRQLPRPGERRTLVVFSRQGVSETRHPALDAAAKTGRLIRLTTAIPDLASRDLREVLRQGLEPTDAQLHPAVRAYIKREGLYGMPPAPITPEVIAGFAPAGYLAKPVLLHGPTTNTSFVPAHVESFLTDDPAAPTPAGAPGSDVPVALTGLLTNHIVQVTVFQAPTTDALDWLQIEGWRALHGFVPSGVEDWPMLFLGRRGADWHLFITGFYAHNRFVRLIADLRELFRRTEIPFERLTVLVPYRPDNANGPGKP